MLSLNFTAMELSSDKVNLVRNNLSQFFYSISAPSYICKRHKNVSSQMYSFLKVKLRLLQRKTYEDKYDICDKSLHTVLACSFNQTAGPGVKIYDVSKQHVHSKFHILFLRKKILGDISCIRNTPKQCINTWQITEV